MDAARVLVAKAERRREDEMLAFSMAIHQPTALAKAIEAGRGQLAPKKKDPDQFAKGLAQLARLRSTGDPAANEALAQDIELRAKAIRLLNEAKKSGRVS